mmetsp:Transcript_28670/g.32123  ORF Transcript_28670/g.32123 Transcript_28670/m.32123 type:complete len:233 (-) Transcript_28670:184-882(-)
MCVIDTEPYWIGSDGTVKEKKEARTATHTPQHRNTYTHITPPTNKKRLVIVRTGKRVGLTDGTLIRTVPIPGIMWEIYYRTTRRTSMVPKKLPSKKHLPVIRPKDAAVWYHLGICWMTINQRPSCHRTEFQNYIMLLCVFGSQWRVLSCKASSVPITSFLWFFSRSPKRILYAQSFITVVVFVVVVVVILVLLVRFDSVGGTELNRASQSSIVFLGIIKVEKERVVGKRDVR